MTFESGLEPGKAISSQELIEIFQCGSQGGMRRSHKTGTLVIVSDPTKAVYEDRWDQDGVLHYTGMGLKGDQKLVLCPQNT